MKYINRGLIDIDDIIQKDVQDTTDELTDAYDEDSADQEMEGEMMDQNAVPPEEGMDAEGL
jgi:hypothetical protein